MIKHTELLDTRCLLIAAVSVVLLNNASNAADKPPAPNIVFLLTDDQRDNTFGAMGHPFVKTPNVDRLLSQSVRFRNTYIAEPVCSPSRVSLLTGMHERVHGVGFTSSYELTEAQWERTYPALLQKAGYHTGFNVPHGSQTTSMYPDYPDWRRMSRPANENPKLKGSPFYDTLYRDIDIRVPASTGTDPYQFIPRFIMDQDKGRRTA
ncbi:MAG: sulfatase-like hydrolase/transferase [Planctomycetota bacterium]